jgi:hypothetical protein
MVFYIRHIRSELDTYIRHPRRFIIIDAFSKLKHATLCARIRYGWAIRLIITIVVKCRGHWSHSYVVPGGASLSQRTEKFGNKIKIIQDAKRIHVRVLQV